MFLFRQNESLETVKFALGIELLLAIKVSLNTHPFRSFTSSHNNPGFLTAR